MGVIHFNEVWTEARVDILKDRWEKGCSASDIARELGCFSHCDDGGRSAVIGKIHRLKLPHPTGKKVRATPAPQARRPVQKPGPISSIVQPGMVAHGGMPRRNQGNDIATRLKINATEPGLPEKLKLENADGRGIKLVQLTPTTCRWPKGDPASEDFEFCGDWCPEDKPYCARHSRLAYAPPAERARRDRTVLQVAG